jgi:predicted  nucleic acid-binding Zn-ribbon protein
LRTPRPTSNFGTQVVAPKRAALAEANRKLEGANKKLAGIRARVKELQDKVATLESGLMKATEDKNVAIAQVGDPGGQGGKHGL